MERNWPLPLRNAIQSLADESAALHVACEITDDDARAYLDDDVIAGFWTVQRSQHYAESALMEALDELTDAEHAQLHSAIATGCNVTVGRIVSNAVRDYVAHWLANEAEEHRDTVPTENSPVARSGSDIYFALTGDRI